MKFAISYIEPTYVIQPKIFLLRKDKEGFEPTVFFKNTLVFKTSALNQTQPFILFTEGFLAKKGIRTLNLNFGKVML